MPSSPLAPLPRASTRWSWRRLVTPGIAGALLVAPLAPDASLAAQERRPTTAARPAARKPAPATTKAVAARAGAPKAGAPKAAAPKAKVARAATAKAGAAKPVAARPAPARVAAGRPAAPARPGTATTASDRPGAAASGAAKPGAAMAAGRTPAGQLPPGGSTASTRLEAARAAGLASATLAASAPARPGAAARDAGRPPTRELAGMRLEVAIGERRLYALLGQDTLMAAAAAVASQETLVYGGKTWTFTTPKGRRTVLGKQADPWWTPPDWFYYEVARRNDLTVRYLSPGRTIPISQGRRLVVRDSAVGVLLPGDATFHPLPEDEHIVFGDTLYVPPGGTRHRRISGELGAFRLDMGDGFLIHGTPDERTVGSASTHGCVRLDGVALAWVYDHVPVGTPVIIR